MEHNKGKMGRPQKTIEALVHRGIIPNTWKEDILQMGRDGKNKLHFANYLGITRNTLYKIMDRDANFLHTINLALEYSQEWWINKVRDGFENDKSSKMNAQLWKYYVENVYRKDWRPAEQQIDITTGGEKLNNPDNKIIVDIVLPKKDEENNEEENTK
jgi:hypothetical protein